MPAATIAAIEYLNIPGSITVGSISMWADGAGSPNNVQWQTIAAAKAKDPTEGKDCRP
jgi:hypothetical protein